MDQEHRRKFMALTGLSPEECTEVDEDGVPVVLMDHEVDRGRREEKKTRGESSQRRRDALRRLES